MTRATKPAARARLAAAGITPRGLSLDDAAAYVSLAPATFLREVAAGTWPRPLPLKGSRRQVWDRDAIDRALDRASGIGAGHESADPIMSRIRERLAPADGSR